MTSIIPNDEWMPAMEAAKLLARRFGGLTIAKQAIAMGLREGLLQARAEWAAYVEEGSEDLTELDATPDEPIEIAADDWLASSSWESDRLGWDWQNGIFEVEGVFVEDDRTFGGVCFQRAEIELLDPAVHPYSALVKDRVPKRLALDDVKNRRGAAARKWHWEPTFADLVAVANSPDGLDQVIGPFKRGFQARLEAWFAKWFSDRLDEAPSEDQCRIQARLVVAAIEAFSSSNAH